MTRRARPGRSWALPWRSRLVVCRQAVELVTDYLEGALSTATRHSFEVHLARCDSCRAYLYDMRVTIALLGRLDRSAVPEAIEQLVARYRDVG